MTDHKSLTAALAAFQAELPHIAKGNTANVPTKTGGKYTYDYADLTDVSKEILPLLAKHGLAWVTAPTHSEHGFSLHYQLRHTSGELIEGFYPLPQAAPQEIGSAVTYARRYALCAVSGVAPGGDDDDAGKAQGAIDNRPATKTRPPVVAPPSATVIAEALKALASATDAGRLDEIETKITQRGVAGVAPVKAALEAARARVGDSTVDHWAVAEVKP